MFICDYCSKAVGPKVSPFIVHDPLQDRKVTYTNFNAEGEAIITSGTEIVAEYLRCPSCTGVEIKKEAPLDLNAFRALTLALQSHAKKCKEHLDECGRCQINVEHYRSIPLPALSYALQDSKAPGMRSSMASLLVERLIERTNDESHRAQSDVAVSYFFLKGYEKRGGGL